MNETDAEKRELWTKLGLLLGVNMAAVNNIVTETTLESHGGNVGPNKSEAPKDQPMKCSKCGAELAKNAKEGMCENCSGTMNSLGKGNHGLQKRSTHALEVSSKADAMSQALQSGQNDKLGHPDAAQVHKEAAEAHMVAAKEASVPGATKGSPDYMASGFHKNKADYHLQQAKFHSEQMPPAVTEKSSGSGINEAPVNQDPPAITQNPTGNAGKCPECGGPMVDGECECGYDEDDDENGDEEEVHNAWSDEARTAALMARQAKAGSGKKYSSDAHEATQAAMEHSGSPGKFFNRTPKDVDHQVAGRSHIKAAEAHEAAAGQAGKHSDTADYHIRAANAHRRAAKGHEQEFVKSGQKKELSGNSEPAVMNRHELISHLVTNCSCWKGEDDVLNELTDDKLKALKAKADREELLERIANAAQEGFTGEDGMAYRLNPETGSWQRRKLVANQETINNEGQPAPTINGKGQKPMIDRNKAIKKIQARLTANGASSDDLEAVATMSDETLAIFNAIPPQFMKKKAPAPVENPEMEEDPEEPDGDEEIQENDEEAHSFDGAKPVSAGSIQVGGKGTKDEYPENKPVKNSRTFSRLLPHEQQALNKAYEIVNRERNGIADQLKMIANSTQIPGKKKSILSYLKTNPDLDSLKATLQLAQEVPAYNSHQPEALYMGANAPLSANQDSGAGDDALELPTLQFNEETKEMEDLFERAKRRHRA